MLQWYNYLTKRIITSDLQVVINFQENLGPEEKNPDK